MEKPKKQTLADIFSQLESEALAENASRDRGYYDDHPKALREKLQRDRAEKEEE